MIQSSDDTSNMERGENVACLNYSGQTDDTFKPELYTYARRMYLKGNLLTRLPKSVSQLQNLRQLHIEGNSLCEIPGEIGCLVNLEYLSVSGNSLTQLLPQIGLLHKLTQIRLSNNHLSQLPKELGQLRYLRYLTAAMNKLSSLPLELINCQQLRFLQLDKNRLTMYPLQLCHFKHLVDLIVAGNALTYLPPMLFDGCSALEEVSVESNPSVQALPLSIVTREWSPSVYTDSHTVYDVELKAKVNYISVDDNRVLGLPVEIEQLCIPHYDAVPTLHELSLQAVHQLQSQDSLDFVDVLPSSLQRKVKFPTSVCVCNRAIFHCAVPAVYKAIGVRGNQLVFLGLFCSMKCCNTITRDLLAGKYVHRYQDWQVCEWTIRQYVTKGDG